MIIACPNKIDCPGSDGPLANLTAEGAEPDAEIFVAWVHQDTKPDDQPNLWEGNNNGTGQCQSTVSQQAADECAQGNATADEADDDVDPTETTDPDNPQTKHYYCNDEGTSLVRCPDGSNFAYTVGANRFCALTKLKANAAAGSYGRQQGLSHKVCLGSIISECCVGEAYSDTIDATGNFLDAHFNFWAITSGSLPPGMSLQYQGYGPPSNPLTGTPTTAGNYSFTVRCTDPLHDYMEKTYSLCVVGITCDPAGADDSHLPEVGFAEDYDVQLVATACADTPLSWQIISGELPLGLSLDEATGVISGTCIDDPGDFTFTVRLQTRAT